MKNPDVPIRPVPFTRRNVAPIDPPCPWSVEVADRWRTLQREYAIRDGGGLAFLRAHCEALETASQAAAVLAAEGLIVRDRFGVPRGHPAAVVLRDSRSQALAALRSLNLDVVPKLPTVGRPGGGKGPA
jgi:hypothetical protein